MPSAANVAKLISLKPGRITIIAPIKPIITAVHLRNPTCSFSNITDNKVTTIGDTKARVRDSARDKTDMA